MRNNDLVPYLSGGGETTNWRQGIIVSWNPDTGANVINVGGTLLENLPFLNSTEASLMTTGDVVTLRTWGASFAIDGRVFYPGSPQAISAFQAITSRVQGASDPSTGTRNSTAWGDLTGSAVGPSVTVRIGTSGKAWVSWSAEMGQISNGVGVIQYVYRNTPHVGIEISGASSVVASDAIALNFNLEHPGSGSTGTALSSYWFQGAMTYVYEGLFPGLTTFTMKYRHDTLNPASGNTSGFNARNLIVFPL